MHIAYIKQEIIGKLIPPPPGIELEDEQSDNGAGESSGYPERPAESHAQMAADLGQD